VISLRQRRFLDSLISLLEAIPGFGEVSLFTVNLNRPKCYSIPGDTARQGFLTEPQNKTRLIDKNKEVPIEIRLLKPQKIVVRLRKEIKGK